MRSMVLPAVALAAGLLTGCTATVTGDAYPPDAYGYQQPDMAYVSPGVQVIADYDEPIFYSDGFYWRFYGGGWYRSTYYTGGWVYARPPVAVMRIDRPTAYVHYRPVGYVARRPASNPGAWRGSPPRGQPGGWHGNPAPGQPGGWRGNPPPAAQARSGWQGGPNRPPAAGPPAGGGWHGAPGPAPAQVHPNPAPAPARPAPKAHGGWRGH